MKKVVLMVDDNERIRKSIEIMLMNDFDIVQAEDKEEALKLFESRRPDVVLLDIEFNKEPIGFEIL